MASSQPVKHVVLYRFSADGYLPCLSGYQISYFEKDRIKQIEDHKYQIFWFSWHGRIFPVLVREIGLCLHREVCIEKFAWRSLQRRVCREEFAAVLKEIDDNIIFALFVFFGVIRNGI